MPGLLGGLGAFGAAYPQYQQQQQQQDMNRMKLQQLMQQMQQAQASRQAQAQALKQLAITQGAGPGGTIMPQQLAGMTNDPSAFSELSNLIRPVNSGMFNLAGRDISGQYGLERAQQQGKNAETVQGLKNTGAADTQTLRNQGSMDVANARNTGAQTVQGMKNAGAKDVAAMRGNKVGAAAVNASSSPEYKTAKSEYEEAKKDERNIESHYPSIAQAYNDPQWLDARKRSITAQKKMESIQTKAAAAAPAGPPKISGDDDYNKLPSGTQFIDPEGNVRTKP